MPHFLRYLEMALIVAFSSLCVLCSFAMRVKVTSATIQSKSGFFRAIRLELISLIISVLHLF